MAILNAETADKFGYDNMKSRRIRNVGKPTEMTDGMPWNIPSFTTTERDALGVNSTTHILIFNSTTSKLNFYDGAAWRAVTST